VGVGEAIGDGSETPGEDVGVGEGASSEPPSQAKARRTNGNTNAARIMYAIVPLLLAPSGMRG
jgi:hypothetical protein